MGFADVNEKELDLVTVGLPHGVEGPDLGPEGRSSETSEDEGDRLLTAEGGEANGVGGFGAFQFEIRREVAGAEGTISMAHFGHDLFGFGGQSGLGGRRCGRKIRMVTAKRVFMALL
jgi:hypothetical protein